MKHKAKILIPVACVLLATLISIRIWCVNAAAPRIEREIYDMGEWVELDGCFFESIEENTKGYAVRVTDARRMPCEKYLEKYGVSNEIFMEGQEIPQEVIEIDLEYRNTGNENGYVMLLSYSLKADGDSIDYRVQNQLVRAVIPEMDDFMNFRIRPDTEYTVSFPFTLPTGYTETGKVPKYLTVSNAPTEKLIKVEVTN